MVSENLGIQIEDISEATSPETVSEWTSMAHLNLMAAVEEEFGIQLTMAEMSGIHNYGELRAVIARYIS